MLRFIYKDVPHKTMVPVTTHHKSLQSGHKTDIYIIPCIWWITSVEQP